MLSLWGTGGGRGVKAHVAPLQAGPGPGWAEEGTWDHIRWSLERSLWLRISGSVAMW